MNMKNMLAEYWRCNKIQSDAQGQSQAVYAAIMAECPLRPGDLFEDALGRGYAIVNLLRWEENENEPGTVRWIAWVAPLKANGKPSKKGRFEKGILPHYRKYGWESVE